MFRHRPRRVPRLNTTSTADISFMLLIFFLVTTSMDVDKGLSRQLPPPDLHPQTEETNVEKHNLMTLEITADNRLY
ncbi:ExbD/TolR family protein, partial [Hoylesella pleuritidis]